jgi:hypothetical protein
MNHRPRSSTRTTTAWFICNNPTHTSPQCITFWFSHLDFNLNLIFDAEERKMENAGLDSSGSQHLLPQVVLVLADRARPLSDGLVLADHDVLGDLVEQSGGC